ncbi:hypothetical protein [Caballeronia zhejiangensis]|nr:hypothetical protein [Caballeronia zhejiangensis]
MKRSIKDLNASLRNQDLRHVNTGVRARIEAWVIRTVATAFSTEGIALFVAGVVFGLGIIKH